MTNPTVLKSCLADGTKPNHQDCVCEEGSIEPLMMVYRTSDHSPNGVKRMGSEGPGLDITGTNQWDIGIVEIPRERPDATATSSFFDKTTAFSDNDPVTVHWLKHGDVVFVKATAGDHGALSVGDILIPQTAGTLGSPDAETTPDTNAHTFSVQRAAATGDTIVKVKYQGYSAIDAA